MVGIRLSSVVVLAVLAGPYLAAAGMSHRLYTRTQYRKLLNPYIFSVLHSPRRPNCSPEPHICHPVRKRA